MAQARSNRVQSVGRALDLLEALTAKEETGLVELAQEVRLLPSTAHRLLATLVERGYVYQNPESGRYLLSYRVLELASHVEHRTSRLRAATQPFLRRIRKVCGETTNLVIRKGDHIVYVDQLPGSMSVRMFTEIGHDVPVHTTGAGKAMLAFEEEEVIDAIAGAEPFEAYTDHTITSAADLREELARIRRRGYALDNEEYEEGVTCVAAPIFDHESLVCGALSVSGPTARIHRADISALGELVGLAALDASRELGFEGPSLWDGIDAEQHAASQMRKSAPRRSSSPR
jgi:DNA-binding IclR family transcriptional regulator